MSNRNKTLIKIYGEEIAMEIPAATSQTIKPCTVIKSAFTADVEYATNLVAGDIGRNLSAIVVKENGMMGKTVDEAYTEGLQVLCAQVRDGDKIQLRLGASETVVAGGLLGLAVSGYVTGTVATDDYAIFQAEESVTTGAGEEAYIIVKKIPAQIAVA